SDKATCDLDDLVVDRGSRYPGAARGDPEAIAGLAMKKAGADRVDVVIEIGSERAGNEAVIGPTFLRLTGVEPQLISLFGANYVLPDPKPGEVVESQRQIGQERHHQGVACSVTCPGGNRFGAADNVVIFFEGRVNQLCGSNDAQMLFSRRFGASL